MNPIRILIADDMPQVRQDLRTVLRLAGQAAGTPIEIVGEAVNGLQAVQAASALHPDVVLIDLEMPLMDGFFATQQIKAQCPAARVLILTVHACPDDRLRALQAGADGFLVKGTPVAEIINAIQHINQKGELS